MKPGDVIEPHQSSHAPLNPEPHIEQQPPTPAPEVTQAPTPSPVAAAVPSTPPLPEPVEPEAPSAPEPIQQAAPEEPPSQDQGVGIVWQAHEYDHHHKGALWYVFAGLGGSALIAGYYFLVGDILSTCVITLSLVVFLVYAGKQPRTLSYSLDGDTLSVGDKQYHLDEFQTFSILEEEQTVRIQLTPSKRFMPTLNLDVPLDTAQDVVDTLGSYLPHAEKQPDLVDRLSKRIKF